MDRYRTAHALMLVTLLLLAFAPLAEATPSECNASSCSSGQEEPQSEDGGLPAPPSGAPLTGCFQSFCRYNPDYFRFAREMADYLLP